MHDSALNYIKRKVSEVSPIRVLDVGGRDINGSVSSLFSCEYVCLDILPGKGVDVVADGADWQSPEPFDLIICAETLEHTARGGEIISRAHSNLVTGGRLVLTTARAPRMPHSAIDGAALRPGEYYSNVEKPTMEFWIKEAGFSSWEIELAFIEGHGGDIYFTAVK